MSENHPKVSIGIPFYNSDKYLAAAIKSVLNQSYENWSLVLLDDGSTDDSLKIAKDYEQADPRITAISDGQNRGLPARLNELTRLSDGVFYARMDADDIMHPNRIENQIKHLVENPSIDVVGSGLISIDNNNDIIGIRKGVGKKTYTLKDITGGGWCVHPTVTGKTEWFKKHPYDEALKRAQDYDLWIRTVESSAFARLEYPYLYYREASTPTLSKVIKANKYSILIYWKNFSTLGIFRSVKLTFLSILKPIIYLVFEILGKTSKLIERRSVPLDDEGLKFHQNIINQIVHSNN